MKLLLRSLLVIGFVSLTFFSALATDAIIKRRATQRSAPPAPVFIVTEAAASVPVVARYQASPPFRGTKQRPRDVVTPAERVPSCGSRDRQVDDILAPVSGS